MTSDVQNLTTFYANLPSIFEDGNSIKSLTDQTMTVIDKKNTYQPMFGSFLFAESEPFANAAFVDSTTSSIDDKQPIDQTNSIVNANSNQTVESSSQESIDDMSDIDDIDEDDFDGIPIRHGSSMTKDLPCSDNHLLERIAQHIEHDSDDNQNLIDVDDLFLNGFQDENHQQQQRQANEMITMPSLFNNIPDIDDLNEHIDDDDDNDKDQIPFDHMDMFDQSDSIRSSSPDSVLSSSHLRDEDDDDDDENYDEDLNQEVNRINVIADVDDDDDDVTQWTDDDLLTKATLENDRPNAPLPPRSFLNVQTNDQVDFIDSSRSNSRCSNASSHLSNGYTDQARIFINDDDGLVTSSSSSSSSSSANSEFDEQDRQDIHADDEIFIRDSDDEEELPLQINLDYDRSRSVSTSSSSDSPQSIVSSIADQSPIIAMDDDIVETKQVLPSAPMAVVDDEEDIDDQQQEEEEEQQQHPQQYNNNQSLISLNPLKTLLDLRNEQHKNHIVHDIVNIQHVFNEHNNDDEFLAIMHNPTIFEEVLRDHDDQQKADEFKQIFSQQSPNNNNQHEDVSFVPNQNMQKASLLSVSDNEMPGPSTTTTTTVPVTKTHSSSTAVNHLLKEKNEEKEIGEEDADVVDRTSPKLKIRQQAYDRNLPNINRTTIVNCEKKDEQDHYQMMDSDDESDNDSELLQTLAQLHGLVHTHRLSNDSNPIDVLMNHETSNLNKQDMINIDDEKFLPQTSKQTLTTHISLSSLSSTNDESQLQDVIIDSDSSSNDDIEYIVEKLISNTLQLAIEQINNSHEPIEHLVEQILSDAIYDIYQENQNEVESKIDHLLSIVQWHQQPVKPVFDPFDQNFDQIWIHDFQTPETTKSDSFDSMNIFSSISNHAQETLSQSLAIDPFNSSDLTASVKNINLDNNSRFQDDFIFFMNDTPTTTTEINEEKEEPVALRENLDENQANKHESFFQDQTRLSQFEDFPSEQPLNTSTLEITQSDIGNPFDESPDIRQSTNDNDEPWELEEQDEDIIKPIPTVVSQNQSLVTNEETDDSTSDSSSNNDDDDGENEKENIDDYFPKDEIKENNESSEISPLKSVRFDDNLQDVKIFTPKDSLIQSEISSQTTTTSDTDEYDDEQITQRSSNYDDIDETANNSTDKIVPRPDSIISLSSDIISYPPPLPPLPPLNQLSTNVNNNIQSKQSSISDSKDKKNSFVHLENTTVNPPATTDTHGYKSIESEFLPSHGSAILRSTSNDNTTIDPDEIDNVITCMIDNNEIKIDAKTISPFKCVIGSAGQLHEDNQTAVIILYGCWLPDHRLREYRYIMDQLFYYVYHKLEQLVIDDYVLVYFHGATPKHRTPELKFLRKCYQMINFRLRKNLRNVYVVHPTRWLRTVIALSRPFFSNKFYHKVQYLYTVSELERQFPHNHISIPVIIEQLDKSGPIPDYV